MEVSSPDYFKNKHEVSITKLCQVISVQAIHSKHTVYEQTIKATKDMQRTLEWDNSSSSLRQS